MSKPKINIPNIRDFNVKEIAPIIFNKKIISDQSKYGAYTLFVNSTNNGRIVFKTDPIKITEGGIYSYNEKTANFFSGENDPRRFAITVPFDPKQKATQELKVFIEKLDSYFNSEEFKKNTFGCLRDIKVEAFEYNGKYTIPTPGEEGKPKLYNTMDRVKFKVGTKFIKDPVPGALPIITTDVYVKGETGKIHKIPISTFKDIESKINRNAIIKFAFSIAKLYVTKPKIVKKILTVSYGVQLKIEQLVILDSGSVRQSDYEYAFSDEEEETESSVKVNKIIAESDDEDPLNEKENISEEENSDSEEEIPKKTKKQSKEEESKKRSRKPPKAEIIVDEPDDEDIDSD